MTISFFFRRPAKIHFSIEYLFDNIRAQLHENIASQKFISPWFSKGIVPRLLMIMYFSRHQGDINHVTGDIHFITLGLKKKRTILTIHDLGIIHNSSNPFKRWLLKTFWIILPVKHSAAIVVVSEATRKQLLSLTNVKPEKVRVIGNFISKNFLYSPKNIDKNRPHFLMIGSAYNKNFDRQLEAIKDLPCFLTIVGHPGESQINALKTHKITHRILSDLTEKELINCYKACDILLFASLLEGFGMPILEAQSVGRAILTSNISAMPEVACDGACYVDPYEISSIREGIQRLINDDLYREHLIKNGLENVKRFSLEMVSQLYLDLYQEVYTNQNK